MLPKSSRILHAAAACLVLLMLTSAGMAGESSQANSPDGDRDKNLIIQLYQDHLSAVDGSRCPMTPSCSEYAAQAVKKHGPVIGWAMAFDRLVRCGRDEAALSPKVGRDGQTYIFDPVGANDFWWFKKKTESDAK